MTRAEAIEWIKTDISRLPNTPAQNVHKEALKIAINSLKVDEMYQLEMEDADEFISKKVFEDIKAEVRKAQEEIYDAPQDVYEPDYWMREGMDYVLEIIEKHISGKENTDADNN